MGCGASSETKTSSSGDGQADAAASSGGYAQEKPAEAPATAATPVGEAKPDEAKPAANAGEEVTVTAEASPSPAEAKAAETVENDKAEKEKEAEEEESEEEDDDEEPPPDWERPMGTKSRASVSAEAYGEWNAKKEFVPPVVDKSDDAKDRLQKCLGKSFLFANLENSDFAVVIGAMKEVVLEAGQRIINQGDDGDFLCVIEKGKFECLIKKPDGSEIAVKTCEEGDVFGELALLYNCPRAASVESKETGTVWQLDRDTFNHIVKEAAQKKRERYDAFLAKVPLLASMDAYERSQLADAIKVETFPAGSAVMTQGEPGEKFYILEEGDAIASKDGAEVMSYKAGDYFGELALIKDQPRAATVTTKTEARLLSVDSRSFKRLINISDLMQKAAEKYS